MEEEKKQGQKVELSTERNMAAASPRFDLKAFHVSKMIEADMKVFRRQFKEEVKDARLWAMIAMFVGVCSLAIHMFGYIWLVS